MDFPDSAISFPLILVTKARIVTVNNIKKDPQNPFIAVANRAIGTTPPPRNKIPIMTAHTPQIEYAKINADNHATRPNKNEDRNILFPVKPLRRLKTDRGRRTIIFSAINNQPRPINGPNKFIDAHTAPIQKISGRDNVTINMNKPEAIRVIPFIFLPHLKLNAPNTK